MAVRGAAVQVLTCTGVSFAHGSNDGQKGMGLIGLPVSTNHILSSGIAGTMVANGSGIQQETVRNILLAWLLTLPVCVLLGAALFGAALLFVLRVLGVH